MRSTSSLFLAVLLVLATPAMSHAQFIHWLGASTISGDSDVFTAGTYVDAFTTATGGYNGKSTSDVTVNNVVFHVDDTGSHSDVGAHLDTLSNGVFTLTVPGGVADGSDGDFPSSGSAAYQSILADCAYSGSAVTVTMSGLTAGKVYEIEVWNSTPYDDTILKGSTAADTQLLDIGQYTLGTFTAGATNSFTFNNGPAHSTVGVIDALEIREIPEPSTDALLGLGALVLFALGQFRRLSA